MTGPGARGRVIVIGSVNVDQVVTVERLPVPGETVTGGRYAQHHGGKGGNQAVAAARLGAPTWFVGAVGDDASGIEALTALAVEGVDVSEAQTLPGETTGVASILVDAAGENLIAVASGANAALTPDVVRAALDRLLPDRADVVLVGHEIPTATAVEAMRMGRTAGAVTVLNPGPALGLTPAVLALADILTPNRTEAAQLVGHDGEPDALASELVGWLAGGGHVLLTLGAEGALLVGVEGVLRVDAPMVDALDTVGAGDALNGALAAGLVEGRTIEDAAYRAVVAASLATVRAGAREGMPTAAELAAFAPGDLAP